MTVAPSQTLPRTSLENLGPVKVVYRKFGRDSFCGENCEKWRWECQAKNRGYLQRDHFRGALFDDQVVDRNQAGGLETQFREHQVDAVEPEGEFILQLRQVGVFQAGTIPDDESPFASMGILQRRQPADALPPPGV